MSLLRAQQRRAKRAARKASPGLTITPDVAIPAEIQPWERELLLPHVQSLLEGMVRQALADDEDEDG
jgi:hypothetical protein